MKIRKNIISKLAQFKQWILHIVTTRCFIVFYVGTVKDTNGHATGYIEFTSDDYLNKAKTIEQILLINKNKIRNIAITNIIELSRNDYKTWNS